MYIPSWQSQSFEDCMKVECLFKGPSFPPVWTHLRLLQPLGASNSPEIREFPPKSLQLDANNASLWKTPEENE